MLQINSRRPLFALGIFCLAAAATPARAADPMFTNAKDCGLPGVKMNCRVWEPEVYKSGSKYPLIVYLHGAGQAGWSANAAENTRIIENTRNWAAKLLAVVNEETGKTNGEYFVVMPQAPNSETEPPMGGAYVHWDWSRTESYRLASTPETQTLKNARAMIDGVRAKYNIDADRLYVIGSSMGGFGTWDLISRNPTMFAAGLPNAGGGAPDAAAGLRNMAIWSHHADRDGAVPVASDREMFKAVALAGGRPLYTETVSNSHSDKGVLGQHFFTWMLAQRRGVPATSNPKLTFKPQGGAFEATVDVAITSDEGTNIRYTLDGSVPSANTGTKYTGPVRVGNSAILIAMVDTGEQKTYHAAPFQIAGKPLPAGAMLDDKPVAPLPEPERPQAGGSSGGVAGASGGAAGAGGTGGRAQSTGGVGGQDDAGGAAGGQSNDGDETEDNETSLNEQSGCSFSSRPLRFSSGWGCLATLLLAAGLRRKKATVSSIGSNPS